MYSNLSSVSPPPPLKKIAYMKGAHQAILGYLFLHIFILFTLTHIFFLLRLSAIIYFVCTLCSSTPILPLHNGRFQKTLSDYIMAIYSVARLSIGIEKGCTKYF